ncbi:energy transducer TonB [Flavobacterium sp.]|uniref:energy transducer TonB n=1 Tax=Flavobacterium sp. TaxID=239 RepID=UPI002612E0D7|nr:energy transducer TonB [Flavobacterium sp.]
MSNLSIFEKKWLDLVFEGKNQEYGAYKLRQDSTKTTILAFFSGTLFIGFVSGIGMLFSSFGSKNDVIPPDKPYDSIIKVDVYVEPKNDEPKPIEPISNNSAPVEKVPNNQNYIASETHEATEDIPTNKELPKDNQPKGNEGGTGTNPFPTNTGSQGSGIVDTPSEPKGPVIAAVLDVQPDFPGGINKFRKQVGEKFEVPEINEEKVVTVLLSFVIEKDGTMTDIKVLKNPGYGLEKEAIRVLKSIKTKWVAGILNGQPVRTQYSLPIKVQMN